MSTRTGIIIVVGAIAIGIALTGYYAISARPFSYGNVSPVVLHRTAPVSDGPAQATGKIDTAVDSILGETVAEDTVLKAAENDASVVTSDSQSVSAFGDVSNQNDF